MKNLGSFPTNWTTPKQLIAVICRIDPYLLTCDHLAIHNLFGKKVDGKGKESKHWVLSADRAKKLMDNEEFDRLRWDLVEKHFGDDMKRLASKSMIALEDKIDGGDMNAIKIALEITGQYKHKTETTHQYSDEVVKKLGRMLKKSFDYDNVKELDGNN